MRFPTTPGTFSRRSTAINTDGKFGWSLIFGRLLVGWLDDHASSSPPAIADYEHRWAFDTTIPAVVIKTAPTEKSAGQSATAKRAAAADLRRVLATGDPERTQGRDILVFDDVCTTGSQLNAVADCLLADGHAARVRGLVLARARWRPM
jgi:hypothetical protein